MFNPGGSSKDRIALAMIEAAEQAGQLVPGGTIVEPTSGNTGVGLAIVAARRGYKCIFVCPDKVATDKIALLRAYGAEVIVCPTSVPPEHPDSYYSVSDRLAREVPLAWKPDQYHNPNNPQAQYETAGTGDLGADARAGHALRGRHRNGRHHHRHRSLPEGTKSRSRSSAPTRRVRSIRAVPDALPGRRDRRGLLAHDL
jgi:hypothetical protein